MMIAAALLLAPAALAGLYQAHQMEVGAALDLQRNGHFRYQLDYGAVSEAAEGDWTFDGKTVNTGSVTEAYSENATRITKQIPMEQKQCGFGTAAAAPATPAEPAQPANTAA